MTNSFITTTTTTTTTSRLITRNHSIITIINVIIIITVIACGTHLSAAGTIASKDVDTTILITEQLDSVATTPPTSMVDVESASSKTAIIYDNVRFVEELPAAVNGTAIQQPETEEQSPPRVLKISTVSKAAQGVFVVSRNAGSKSTTTTKKNSGRRSGGMQKALNRAAAQGLEAMMELYNVREPGMLRRGHFLDHHHPGAILSQFSAPTDDGADQAQAAYAALQTLKQLKKSHPARFAANARAAPPRISLRRTPLEGLCPPRQSPAACSSPASRRYRTLDGTCNNARKPRWGSAQSPFHRFLAPAYADGVELVRRSVVADAPLASARFVSLLVHGTRDEDAAVTHMLAQWGQFVDHDVTSTAQPRSINGSIPSCCDSGPDDFQHPSCLPIKVPNDDPWLAPLQIHCLEFLRSAPALRPDCALSWREQTNQVTSYLDASPIYSSNLRTSESVRSFRDGRLHFGRGAVAQDVCQRNALANQCIRSGDGRSGEQPGLLAMHHVWVGEHNRLASELARMNGHWSDEKLFQEARRIVGAMVQHITYREFVPVVVGREVCRLFDLELVAEGYYERYDVKVNPTVANAFSSAAFRFGHSLIQGSYMRCAANHQFIFNNVTLHNENANGDMGTAGSLHRMLRGLAAQRSQKRDEFITAELTNHLFQSGGFPFGLDLAAINIQRGRDHGLPAYTQWREPCGLSPVRDWADLERVVGAESARRMQQGYRSIDDVDLFVAGLAERPVIGGLVGPTFACIIAQQFANLRRGDRFWYENGGFESSFTPAQLQSLRQVSLAQVLCRTLAGGTLQPHVFLPNETPNNARRQCGFAELAAIDLSPWQERDPAFVKKDDGARQPTRESFANKQESLELPEFINSGRPNRGPSASVSSTSGPLPGSFIVELQPDSLTKPLRPNREPPARPAQEHFAHLRPSPQSFAPASANTATNHFHNTVTSTASTTFVHPNQASTSSQVIVDKVDFISNGDTGIVHSQTTNHDHHHNADIQTDRPIDNKLDFKDKRPPTQIIRPNKRPVFQLTTNLRTADSIIADSTATTSDDDLINTIAAEHTKTKREVKARSMANQTVDAVATPKFGFNANARPQNNQQIQYPSARPTRIKAPNVVIIQGSQSDTSTDFDQFEQYPDYPQTPDKYGLYRPSYTSTTTTRPTANRYEYEPNLNQYAISYDVTVTTTEKYTIFKPPGQPGQPAGPFGPREPFYPDEPFADSPTDQRPTFSFRPDKVSSPKPPTYTSTPFSWDTRREGFANERHDRGWPSSQQKYQPPSKLDFSTDPNSQGLSPFSGSNGQTYQRPGTIYVMSNDDDDYDATTQRQSNKLQSMDQWQPNAGHAMTTENPSTTTIRSPVFSPSTVLTNIYSSITRFFGYGKNHNGLRLGHEMDMDNGTGIPIADWTVFSNSTIANLTDYLTTDNRTLQYDLDGYLRPEYMHQYSTRPTTEDNNEESKTKDDNAPMPVDWHQLESRANNPHIISIVPIEVLTRPERPDNWVFVDAVQSVGALPLPPPLQVSENAVREMPRPFRPVRLG